MVAKRIYTDNGRVCMLIFYIGGNGSHANAHRSDKDKGIVLIPLLTDFRASDDLGTKFTLEDLRNILACLTDLYDGYLLHFKIVIG
jgi:hypothetical protein